MYITQLHRSNPLGRHTLPAHKRHKHHFAITLAVAIGAFAYAIVPIEWEHLSPFAGFLASLLWIWSE